MISENHSYEYKNRASRVSNDSKPGLLCFLDNSSISDFKIEGLRFLFFWLQPDGRSGHLPDDGKRR